MKILIFGLAWIAFCFAAEKEKPDEEYYFVDVLQHRNLKPDGSEYGSDKGLVFGLLGKSFKKGDLPLKKMKLMTNKGVEEVQFDSVVKNCREYSHPVYSRKYMTCQDYAVFKYEGASKPIMLFNFPFEAKNVEVPEWRPITDWNSVKSFLLKKENFTSVIISDFDMKIQKVGTNSYAHLSERTTGKSVEAFDLNELEKSCKGEAHLDWVSLYCRNIKLYYKGGRFIISSSFVNGVEHGSTLLLEASFLSNGELKYYLFRDGDWMFGKLKIYRETEKGGFVKVENNFVLDPMKGPIHP